VRERTNTSSRVFSSSDRANSAWMRSPIACWYKARLTVRYASGRGSRQYRRQLSRWG
jgi:hypothetical protein